MRIKELPNIIIEGPDGSGKSTLVDTIKWSWSSSIDTIAGEGPEKYPGEIITRNQSWLGLMRMSGSRVFDRHPSVSQNIYGSFKNDMTRIPQEQIDEFHKLANLIVYCRRNGAPQNHQIKGYDTLAHQSLIMKNDEAIRRKYDEWAIRHAHVIYDYRRDNPITVLKAIEGIMKP